MGEPCRHGRPERALPVYTVDEPVGIPADRVVAAVTTPAVESGNLEALLRRLLPTALVSLLPPQSIPTDMELLLQRLLSGVPAPTPSPQTGIAGMETLMQRLQPKTPILAARRDWSMMVCFSCGKPGHGVGRC